MQNYTDTDKALLAELSDRMVREPVTTQRVLLRPFRRSDLQDYYEYASQKEQQRLSGNWPCNTLEDAALGLDFFMDPSHPPYAFAIELKAERKVIGNLSIGRYMASELSEEMQAHRGVSLSYVLNENYWNCGIMTELLQALYKMLFEQAELDFINSGYFTYNKASERLQKKLGMKRWMEHSMEWNNQSCQLCEMVLWREEWRSG